MKQMFKSLCAVVALGALVAGCSKEGQGPDGTDTGKKSFVKLVINTEVPKSPSRAGTFNDQPATTTAETTLDPTKGVRVVVFNEAGQQSFKGDMTLTSAGGGAYETQDARIEVPAGRHYFFVFANELKSLIALPTAGQTKDQWMAAQFGVTYTKNANQDATGLDIATADAFLLGSLWQEVTIAPAGGKNTNDEAAVIQMQIGRLASKIVLTEVNKGTSNMKGTFTLPKYRMGTLSLKMTNVGVASEGPLGSTKTNILVTSAKHDSPFTKNANVTTPPYLFNDTDFQRYSEFKEVKADASNFFYAAENTTARQSFAVGGITGIGAQFYGNTTYVQIETVYTPVDGDVANGEVYVLGGTPEAPALTKTTLSGATFYTAGVGANRIILATKPASLNAAEAALLGVSSVDDIVTYTDGKNYHKFPVQDPGETDYLYKNRVLRNHYYTYTVDNIEELGSYTPEVDPVEPIEDVTFLKLSIRVRNWDKVSDGIDL